MFLCDESTEKECLERLLLGTSPNPKVLPTLQQVAPGDYLFLYNYESGRLRGPYVALTALTQNLEPNAWRNSTHSRGFPWQVKVSDQDEFPSPITADDIQGVLPLRSTRIGFLPPTELDDEQLSALLQLFQRKAGGAGGLATVAGAVQVYRPTPPSGDAYIFKCDRVTGAHCFDTGIMGAPVRLFRSVVSRIRPGATVFLWQIEERKLYGVWRASSRGQYDPTAFADAPERALHAIVHCSRPMKLGPVC